MAIYHFSVQIISRAEGKSSVAAAAYRAGEKIKDERTGKIYDYSFRERIEKLILAPENAPDWVYDRKKLWNEVERVEKRKDSQLAREINVALPRELCIEENKKLAIDFCKEVFVKEGMIADICFHFDNPNNPHFHVMLTMREINESGFGKKNRTWNDRKKLEFWREKWAEYMNRYLEKNGIEEKVSHLSYVKQGIDKIPTIHIGPKRKYMAEKGYKFEIFNNNMLVREYNVVSEELEELKKRKELYERQKRDILNAKRIRCNEAIKLWVYKDIRESFLRYATITQIKRIVRAQKKYNQKMTLTVVNMLVNELKRLRLEREKLIVEIEKIRNLQNLASKINELELKKNDFKGVKKLVYRKEIEEIESRIRELKSRIAAAGVKTGNTDEIKNLENEVKKLEERVRQLNERIEYLRDAEEIKEIYTKLRAEEKRKEIQKCCQQCLKRG